MIKFKTFVFVNCSLILALIMLNSCGIYRPVSAKDYPPEPEKRIAKNMEEGRGFRIMDRVNKGGGNFEFASSNELWRASLDTIDFMPLASANYSGGIIITDWYSDESDTNESIKITIRFLTNEIRSDALDVKIFKKNCSANQTCKMFEESGDLILEIKKSILRKAAIYEKTKRDKKGPDTGNTGFSKN